MGDMSIKQYKKMMSNKPAEKKEHHNLATIMGSKSKALSKAKGGIPKHIEEHREKKFMENYNKDRNRNFK